MTALKIVRPGFLTTVQDLGRWGHEQWGVPVGGVLDDYAARWANWLLSNPDDAAVLEMTAMGPELEVVEGGALALAGADFDARIDGERWLSGSVARVSPGQRIRIGSRRRGLRAYLAVSGGVDVPRVLGSRATDMAAGVGGYQGRPLKAGDVVRSLESVSETRTARRNTIRIRHRLRVMPGVRIDRFAPGIFTRLLTRQYQVSGESSAMGLRLDGEPLATPRGDWPSEGMAIGAIECPPSGMPLLLLKNRGSLGGYPVLAHVIRADWPALGQVAPGDPVTFEAVTRAQALAALSRQMQAFDQPDHLRIAAITAPYAACLRRRDRYGRGLPRAGDWIEAGETLCYLECLGTEMPVYAPHAGTLEQIGDDQAVVDAGETLASIAAEDMSSDF